jgi:hypothetical protein
MGMIVDPWKALLELTQETQKRWWCHTCRPGEARTPLLMQGAAVSHDEAFYAVANAFLRSPFILQCQENCLQHGCTDWQPA